MDDTSGQCVFELQQEDKHCCFASRAEQEELCSNRNEASKGCREHTEMWSSKYSLELRRKQDDTILFLPNFQESDAGVYTITCSGSHVKKVELKGNSQIRNYPFQIDSSEKKIIFSEHPAHFIIIIIIIKMNILSYFCYHHGQDMAMKYRF